MSLFDNGDPEEFLLFVRNFNITLSASGALEVGTKGQYLCTLVHGEALLHFDSFSADVESTQTLNVDDVIKGLVQYFPPNSSLQTRVQRYKKFTSASSVPDSARVMLKLQNNNKKSSG